MNENYRKQVQLLLDVLPELVKLPQFALKGGTALNFFWHNMPRLSVDIDLVYLPIKDRTDSLREIELGLTTLTKYIKERIAGVTIQAIESGGTHSRLVIRTSVAQIKIETNTIIRGSLFDTHERELCSKAQNLFQKYSANKTLSYEDLYGGKLCAALDRQHPRDLFDIKQLLDELGLTKSIIHAFIGYLISHSRPINELLNPKIRDLVPVYEKEFSGMTVEQIEATELNAILSQLPEMIVSRLTREDKNFLMTFKEGNPDWNLLPISHLMDLPAVQWKLQNIRKMDRKKHQIEVNKLARELDLS